MRSRAARLTMPRGRGERSLSAGTFAASAARLAEPMGAHPSRSHVRPFMVSSASNPEGDFAAAMRTLSCGVRYRCREPRGCRLGGGSTYCYAGCLRAAHAVPPGPQITFKSACRLSFFTTDIARSSASGSTAGSSTRPARGVRARGWSGTTPFRRPIAASAGTSLATIANGGRHAQAVATAAAHATRTAPPPVRQVNA